MRGDVEEGGDALFTDSESFCFEITIDALRFLLPFLEELFDDAVYLPSLKVVFVRLNMDSEQAGAVWSEFVANVVEGIDGSVFPRFDMKNRPHIVYSLLNGVCLPR